MSAPRLINPPPTSGGVPVGGSGTVGTLPIWVGASTLGNSAVTQVSGSIFSLTGLVAGGPGYTTSEIAVALTGGTGTGATGRVQASGGSVTFLQLADPGQNYTAGDVLTISGGGGNATITVLAVVPKNDAAGHLTAQRIGAGTTQPQSGVDSRFGAWIRGVTLNNVRYRSNFVDGTAALLNVGGVATNIDFYSPGSVLYAQKNMCLVTSATAKGAAGIYAEASAETSTGATSVFYQGSTSVATRSWATDANTNVNLVGGAHSSFMATAGPFTTTAVTGTLTAAGSLTSGTIATGIATVCRWINSGSVATTTATLANLEYLWTSGSIGTAYGLRLPVPTVGAMATPAAYYPIAQEHTEGRNYVRAPTFFGSAVGTARSATNPSVEVEAVAGVSNGDVRLRSASAVFDASNSSTNGVRFFARTTGDLPTSTTQTWYEEGTYTPTGAGWQGTLAGSWTRIGRKVFVTINLSGTPNGNAAASTLTLPSGLAPARGGAGLRVKTATGTALGNGVCSVDNVTGLIQISTAVTVDNDPKTIQVEYEV